MRLATIAVGILLVLSLMALSFVGGMVVTAQLLQSDPSRVLAARAVFADSRGGQTSGDAPGKFKLFWEAWRIAHDHYVDEKALNDDRLTYGAIQGMLDALGD